MFISKSSVEKQKLSSATSASSASAANPPQGEKEDR